MTKGWVNFSLKWRLKPKLTWLAASRRSGASRHGGEFYGGPSGAVSRTAPSPRWDRGPLQEGITFFLSSFSSSAWAHTTPPAPLGGEGEGEGEVGYGSTGCCRSSAGGEDLLLLDSPDLRAPDSYCLTRSVQTRAGGFIFLWWWCWGGRQIMIRRGGRGGC